MATFRAKCWLGQSAGYQDLEVQANTLNGAKQQFERVYGATQIINLHEVRGGSGSSYTSGSSEGFVWLLGIGFILYLLTTYWYIAVPIAVILCILIGIGLKDK